MGIELGCWLGDGACATLPKNLSGDIVTRNRTYPLDRKLEGGSKIC